MSLSLAKKVRNLKTEPCPSAIRDAVWRPLFRGILDVSLFFRFSRRVRFTLIFYRCGFTECESVSPGAVTDTGICPALLKFRCFPVTFSPLPVLYLPPSRFSPLLSSDNGQTREKCSDNGRFCWKSRKAALLRSSCPCSSIFPCLLQIHPPVLRYSASTGLIPL